MKELVDVISLYLMRFALPRRRIRELWELKDKLSPEEYDLRQAKLRDEAYSLFKKAHKNTKRNGEAGELLLYLLTEWILKAPQILAKMSLKTNAAMPVYGADGVHVRFDSDTGKLEFFWGESKLHASINGAITAAAESIAESLKPEKLSQEFFLVERDIDLSGLSPSAREAFKKYLNPVTPESNQWVSRITCLIGFDFAAYGAVKAGPAAKAEETFRTELATNLKAVAEKLAIALKAHGLEHQELEIFLFPVPAVANFRDLFQDKIGWKATDESGESN